MTRTLELEPTGFVHVMATGYDFARLKLESSASIDFIVQVSLDINALHSDIVYEYQYVNQWERKLALALTDTVTS